MIQSATEFYKQIHSSMVASSKKIVLTKQTLSLLQAIFHEFSQKLNVYIDSFNKMIMKDICTDLIKQKTFKKLSSNTKNAIIEPFGMFIENYRDTNRTLSKKVSDVINDLDNSRKEIDIIKQNSYQNWIKSDKAKQEIQKALEKVQKGSRSIDLSKINENSLKLVMNAEKVQDTYRALVRNFNFKWKNLQKQFENLCVLFEYSEESRLSFEKITFTTALKLLGQAGLIESDIDKRILESEELLKANTLKQPLFQLMRSKRKYQVIFDQKERQALFIPYDEYKKQKSSKKQILDPYRTIPIPDRQQILHLIDIWLNQTQLIKLAKDIEKIKAQILSTTLYSNYFVDSLQFKIKSLDHYYCKMEPQHFTDLLNVLTLISRTFEYDSQKQHSQLYKLINISLRLSKKSKGTGENGSVQLMSSSLGKNSKIFSSQELWLNVLKLIRLKYGGKVEGSIIKSGFAFLNKIGDFMTGRDEEKQEADYFHSIKELTILMSSLSVPTEFSIPFIKKLLQKRQQAFDILKNILYTKQDLELRQRLTDPKSILKYKQNKQLAIFHSKTQAIACLKILSQTGILNQNDVELRLVCRFLRNVHKQIYHNLKIQHKWLKIMGCQLKDYSAMKREVNQNSSEATVQQIITLDVNRSLHIHNEYLSSQMLQSLLRTFAYFNKDISYCQGMNYLAGYLFIKTRNQSQSYSLFQKLMHTHFRQLFLYEFQFLKMRMYQFQRLLGIFLPKISDHFKRQMISSQCYIVSWIIALYSATYQYCLQSYLVDYLWDKFIVHGWKEFFKFTLWIFSLYKSQLLDLSFDRVLHFLGDLTKTELFLSGKEEIKKHEKIEFEKIGQQVDRFKISNGLLEELKRDYEVAKRLEDKV